MIDENLLNKFNQIEDLPVSEEMLGAYLEGNLRGTEFREVQNYIYNDTPINSLIRNIEVDMNSINDLDNSNQQGLVDISTFEDAFTEISLPEITMLGMNSLMDLPSSLNDENYLIEDNYYFMGEDGHFIHSHNLENNHNNCGSESGIGVIDKIE